MSGFDTIKKFSVSNQMIMAIHKIKRCAWIAALKWYKSVAEECEKDCVTDKDFRTLYFHLRQVLENEINEM